MTLPTTKKKLSADVTVPLLFLFLCIVCIFYSGKPLPYILSAIVERFGRNSFLVLSLIIPVMAGIGLNFSIVIGAIAAQIALIFVSDWKITGLTGIFLATLLSVPPAVIFGYLVGKLFNRARGREMVTGLIAGFFSNGLYQLVFLFGAGTLIPILNKVLLLPRGLNEDGTQRLYGLRNTIDLSGIQYSLDTLLPIHVGPILFPIFTFLLIGLGGLFVVKFKKTKLGQEMKAMGLDYHVAEVAGIPVERNRIIATIISTVMAAFGQILFLQNIGTMNTYNSHEQVGMFSIAALLVSGASVSRAGVLQALLGTLILQTLFLTSPLAGNTLFGNAQIGEYFRVFITYGVIAVALAMHAMHKKKS